MGCRKTACFTMIISTGCRAISAPAPGAPPPPPSSLTLVSAELFLSHILTPLFSCSFIALLKYVIPEVLPLSLIDSALASSRSVLEPAGIGSIRHRGSFWQLLTEATPIAPPATKTLPRKPNTERFLDASLCHQSLWEESCPSGNMGRMEFRTDCQQRELPTAHAMAPCCIS